MYKWIHFIVLLIGFQAVADLKRWQTWEIERNDLYLNPSLYHQLPLKKELTEYQTDFILSVKIPISKMGFIKNGKQVHPSILGENISDEMPFFIHPKATSLFSVLMQSGKVEKIKVNPTTSPRVFFLNDKFIKLSLPQQINGAIRTIYPLQMKRATYVNQIFDSAKDRFNFLPEELGVFDLTPENPFGFIIRTIPDEIVHGKNTLVPLLSYVANHPEGSLMLQNAKQKKMTLELFVQNVLMPSLIKKFLTAASLGVAIEAHQQNLLLELDKNGLFTGRIFYRDLDGCRVDFDLRKRLGFDDSEIKTDPEFDWVFDTQKIEYLNSTIKNWSLKKSTTWSGVIEKAWTTYVLGSAIHLLQKKLNQNDVKLNLTEIAQKQLNQLSDQIQAFNFKIKNDVEPYCNKIYR